MIFLNACKKSGLYSSQKEVVLLSIKNNMKLENKKTKINTEVRGKIVIG